MNFKDKLIKAGVVKKGHFRQEDGKHSDTYINKDAIYCNPELFAQAIISIEELGSDGFGLKTIGDDVNTMNGVDCGVIIGSAIAGAVLAAPIALRTGKIFVYLEKVASLRIWDSPETPQAVPFGELNIKTHVQLRRGYDKVVAGKKVLLVEDIITTGGSVKDTIKIIGEAGGQVVEVRCIWNRGGIHEFMGEDGDPMEQPAPVLSIINEPVESWEPDECPLCKGMISVLLTDPKTGETINGS